MNFKIDYKIFFFALFFCITKQIRYYIIIMIFASIHECAHLITGLLIGFRPKKIGILPVGFVLSFKEDINCYNKKILKDAMLKKDNSSTCGTNYKYIYCFNIYKNGNQYKIYKQRGNNIFKFNNCNF